MVLLFHHCFTKSTVTHPSSMQNALAVIILCDTSTTTNSALPVLFDILSALIVLFDILSALPVLFDIYSGSGRQNSLGIVCYSLVDVT